MMSSSKSSFFKQSGWMGVATLLGGVFMMFVHTVAQRMGDEAYPAFAALLKLTMIFIIPATALQTIFTRQMAAAAIASDTQTMARTSRAVTKGMVLLWLVFAVLSLSLLSPLSAFLKIPNKTALVFMILLVLTTLLPPVFKGLLQGQHRFGSLGFLAILDGIGRLVLVCLVVLIFQRKLTGAMSAVVASQGVTLVVAIGLTRKVWRIPVGGSFHWKPWIDQLIPLTIGVASFSLLSYFDLPFVQSVFLDKHNKMLYTGGQAAGFALVQFITPIASVMFPRVVQSLARGEKTNTMALTVGITALVGVLGGVFLTLFPKLPLYIMFRDREMLQASPLVPLYVWAMIPITLATVLILNLLAHAKYKALPWLISVAILYVATLELLANHLVHMENIFDAFRTIIYVMGGFGTLLCAIAAWFTWKKN